MFSTKSIRDLNKIEIFYIKPTTDKTSNRTDVVGESKLFLYTTQGWDYQFSIDTGSHFLDSTKNLIKSPLLSLAFTGITGMSTVIDVERKYAFSGSKPLEFTVTGFRLLENSLEDDIYKPVNTLLNWLLPTRGKETFETIGKLLGDPNAMDQKTGVEPNIAQKALMWLNNHVGDIYSLNVPDQFKLEDNSKMAVKIGGQFIRNVFIKSVSIKTPKFYYADEQGNPMPDRVDFSITFETLRSAIKDDYNFGR